MLETPLILIGNKFTEGVIPLIHEAKGNIDIIVYDWRVYPNTPDHPVSRLTTALSDAVKRGVRVRCLVNSKTVRDFLISQHFQAKVLETSKILHAKSMLIDGRISICGSHNYTQGGMMINHEISLVVDLGEGVNDLQKYFNDLYGGN